jgi:hypothetical protein
MSKQLKSQLAALSSEVRNKIHAAEIAMIRANIIQELILENIHIASEKYAQSQQSLSHHDKREISMFLHQLYHPDVIQYYIANLPEQKTKDEHDVRSLVQRSNVDVMVYDAMEAKKELDVERSLRGK